MRELVAELARVQIPRRSLKSCDFSYERFTAFDRSCFLSTAARPLALEPRVHRLAGPSGEAPREADDFKDRRRVGLIRLMRACYGVHAQMSQTTREPISRSEARGERGSRQAERALGGCAVPTTAAYDASVSRWLSPTNAPGVGCSRHVIRSSTTRWCSRRGHRQRDRQCRLAPSREVGRDGPA